MSIYPKFSNSTFNAKFVAERMYSSFSVTDLYILEMDNNPLQESFNVYDKNENIENNIKITVKSILDSL